MGHVSRALICMGKLQKTSNVLWHLFGFPMKWPLRNEYKTVPSHAKITIYYQMNIICLWTDFFNPASQTVVSLCGFKEWSEVCRLQYHPRLLLLNFSQMNIFFFESPLTKMMLMTCVGRPSGMALFVTVVSWDSLISCSALQILQPACYQQTCDFFTVF